MLDAIKHKHFDKATGMQEQVQGFCDYIYGRPFGDYRARCKVALVHMGLLTAEQTYVRPPYTSLWDADAEAARRAVERAGLLAVAART
jgi:dihydrodipicolinate synthase/N-acetylneuraminate lyase